MLHTWCILLFSHNYAHVFLAGWQKSFFLSFLHVLRSKWLRSTFDGALEEKKGVPKVVVSTAAFHAKVRGLVPGIGGLKEKNVSSHPRVYLSIVGSLRDRAVACSDSDRQGSNFESCVWRTVSSQSSHHPQEVLLAGPV